METYIGLVKAYPLLMAAIQFAILGLSGEILAYMLREKRLAIPFTIPKIFAKMIAWAILGIVIKYGFVLIKGGVASWIDHGLIPVLCREGLAWAILVSVTTNAVFGPPMMFFHRIEDNIIDGKKGFDGIEKSLKTLIWFWPVAHTFTFLLPTDYQIGIAALWSVVLGVIMGIGIKR